MAAIRVCVSSVCVVICIGIVVVMMHLHYFLCAKHTSGVHLLVDDGPSNPPTIACRFAFWSLGRCDIVSLAELRGEGGSRFFFILDVACNNYRYSGLLRECCFGLGVEHVALSFQSPALC